EDRYPSAEVVARELDLCLPPRARALLHVTRSWRSIPKRFPVAAMVVAGLAPNVVLAALNIAYNVQGIVGKLSDHDQWVFFRIQIPVVNSVAYALGLGWFFNRFGRLFGSLGRLARGQPAPELSADAGRLCLGLGDKMALVTALLWTISGLVFPTWMQLEG